MSAWLPVLTTFGGVAVGWVIGWFRDRKARRWLRQQTWYAPVFSTRPPTNTVTPPDRWPPVR